MTEDHRTFRLRYVGARFDGARLPLDVLSDLLAFRDLLVCYAKDRWRAHNLSRRRLPKGFDKSISFDLIGVENGSAVAKLDWSRRKAQVALPGFTDELEQIVDESFVDLTKLIFEAGNQRFPAALSSEHIRALNTLGSGLQDNEKIEFIRDEDTERNRENNIVYLDNHRRKELITRVRNTYQVRYEGIGELRGLHVNGQLKVNTMEYGELSIPVDPDRVTNEFDGNTGADIQFALQIELDNHDTYQRIVEAFDVELVDQQISENIVKCKDRLAELRRLAIGWLDGSAASISGAAISAAEQFLARRPSVTSGCRIFPTDTGGVNIEFVANGWDYSVEFRTEGKTEFYGVQIDGADEVPPLSFDGLSKEFFDEFDARVKQ